MFNPIRLLSFAEQDLFKLNMLLKAEGFPFYHLGGKRFNSAYRMAPGPRIIGKWFPPFVAVSEIYLSYWNEEGKKFDIVYKADWDQLTITEDA